MTKENRLTNTYWHLPKPGLTGRCVILCLSFGNELRTRVCARTPLVDI